ncbi:hypothetical protein V8C86DRAFT_2710460 [Haematococcus lacustris]
MVQTLVVHAACCLPANLTLLFSRCVGLVPTLMPPQPPAHPQAPVSPGPGPTPPTTLMPPQPPAHPTAPQHRQSGSTTTLLPAAPHPT